MQNKVEAAVRDFISDPEQWSMSLAGSGAIRELENKYSELVGQPYTVAVANATTALWAIFSALDIHDSDVIVSPYTWGGSLAGLIQCGNRPVFADIDRNTLCLDPVKVIKKIRPATKAILATDIYGYPCDGPALRRIADEYGLMLIQDCAQSFGAYIKDKHTGWWADASVISMTFGKALFAGEGGVIVTDNQKLYQQIVLRTQHPARQMRDIPYLPVNEFGLNLRMNPVAAVWANTAFNDALVVIERRYKSYMQVFEFLHSRRHIKNEIPDINFVKPSFHVMTFDPLCKIETIEEVLKINDLPYEVNRPSIATPLYRHESYIMQAILKKWPKQPRCPVAEEQCINRLRLVERLLPKRVPQ